MGTQNDAPPRPADSRDLASGHITSAFDRHRLRPRFRTEVDAGVDTDTDTDVDTELSAVRP